jgi:hypothetical protein
MKTCLPVSFAGMAGNFLNYWSEPVGFLRQRPCYARLSNIRIVDGDHKHKPTVAFAL